MPGDSIPLRKTPRQLPSNTTGLAPSHIDTADDAASRTFSSPVLVSGLSSRQHSRNPSPFASPPDKRGEYKEPESPVSDLEFDNWDEHDSAMPSDLRPELDREHHDGRANAPLLGGLGKISDEGMDRERTGLSRRSTHTMHERDPETQARFETRRKYTYAGIFLALSLVSFTVQTETAVYIQHELKWEKPYCMLYMTHGSWILLWPVQLLLLKLQQWNTPWPTFWRRHTQLLRQTSLMVQHQTLHPSARQSQKSPLPYMIKMTAFVTCALTVAGGSWYLAVDLTTASDLTAIYNCSAFFAYAFSVPLLHEKLHIHKVLAVAIAIIGVFIVAYGGPSPAKHGSKSGGGAGGKDSPPSHEANNRALGNTIIGIGSVLYGFYEVLYKKLACPPEGCSPGRGMVFANTFGSCIGLFTVLVLWIPIPFLHYTGWEEFGLPRGQQASMMAISVIANASTYIPTQTHYKVHANTSRSILRLFPHPHLSHLPRPLQCRRPPHHLHRGHRRPTASTAIEPPTHISNYRRRAPHHRGILSAQLGNIQRDG
jgi:drug/metabolite transporter (DMT)-like permease